MHTICSHRRRHTDKSDRATVEQVLDPRTRMILFKLLNRGFIYAINGCISTGKEANVYHAIGPSSTPESLNENTPSTPSAQRHLALKIYKTSILTFKDRDRYVTGEYRFRHGYSKSNPRKMVQLWAEKEYRNLKRLNAASIPSPIPVELKLHVLIMTFIGDPLTCYPAPRLKDILNHVQLTEQSDIFWIDLYEQAVMILRTMYHECHLIHADFSEYNIL